MAGKFLSYSLGLLILIESLGLLYWHQVALNQHKKEVFARVDKAVDCSFVFAFNDGMVADEDFIWVKNGKEFIYHNRMYDIVSAEYTNDSVVFLCHHDKKEEEMIRKYHALTKKREKSRDKDRRLEIPLFHFNTIFFEAYQMTGLGYVDIEYAPYNCMVLFIYPDIPAPPPKSA